MVNTFTETKTIQYDVTLDPSFDVPSENDVIATTLTPNTTALYRTAAASQSMNNINIQTNLTSDAFVSKYVTVNVPDVQIAIGGITNAQAGITDFASWNKFFGSFNHLALSSWGLANIIEACSIEVNGHVINNNPYTFKMLPVLSSLKDDDEYQNSTMFSTSGIDSVQTYSGYDEAASNLNFPTIGLSGKQTVRAYRSDIDSPFITAGKQTEIKRDNRRCNFTVPDIFDPAAEVSFVIELLQLPIPLSVFSSTGDASSLVGIRNIKVNLMLDLGNIQKIFSTFIPLTNQVSNYTQAEINWSKAHFKYVSNNTPELHVYTAAFSPEIVKTVSDTNGKIAPYNANYLKMEQLYLQTISLRANVLKDDGSFVKSPPVSLNFNNLTFSKVPLSIFATIVKKKSGSGVFTSEYAATARATPRIKTMVVRYNGLDSFGGYGPTEIALLNTKNGLKRSVNDQLYSAGNGLVILNMSKDVGTATTQMVGHELNSQTLSISVTLESLTVLPETIAVRQDHDAGNSAVVNLPSLEEYEVYIFAINSAIMSYDNGSISTRDVVIPGHLGIDKLQIRYQELHKARKIKTYQYGGSIFGTIASVLKQVGKAAWQNRSDIVKLLKKIGMDAIANKPGAASTGGYTPAQSGQVVGGATLKKMSGGAKVSDMAFY